jgi:pimeloyl-ACP methyl ester carboxylesterase
VTGPLIAEDVVLLLLHDGIGPPATATTLLHALGGAVLVDLAHRGRVGVDGPTVVALGDPPADPVLRAGHATVARWPRTVRSLVPELGAELWEPVVDRLVERGRLRRERTRPLGLHPVTVRPPADPHHEAALRAHLRAVREGGGRPDVRTAAVLALLSASGALPTLRRAPDAAVVERAAGAGDRAAAVVAAVLARVVAVDPVRRGGACAASLPYRSVRK